MRRDFSTLIRYIKGLQGSHSQIQTRRETRLAVQERPNGLSTWMESHLEKCLLDQGALQLELRMLVFALP